MFKHIILCIIIINIMNFFYNAYGGFDIKVETFLYFTSQVQIFQFHRPRLCNRYQERQDQLQEF